MGRYRWYGVMWSYTGCPGEYYNAGWWTSDGKIFVTAEHRNPETDKPYTDEELDKIQGVVVPPIVIPSKPVKPASAASVWILGVIVLVLAAGIVWFVTK